MVPMLFIQHNVTAFHWVVLMGGAYLMVGGVYLIILGHVFNLLHLQLDNIVLFILCFIVD